MLEYSNFNEKNHLDVGYDFASGAWYRVWQFKEMIAGIDPGGEAYTASEASAEPLPGETFSGSSWLLDTVMPQVGLVDVLRDKRWPVRIEAEGDGMKVTASLPRGSRMPVESLPSAEIERWGGPDGMLRDVVYVLRDDLSVASRTRPTSHNPRDPRTKTEVFDVAPCSPGGFQVVQTHPSPGGMTLIDCVVETTDAGRLFERQSVVDRAIEKRIARPEITPVISAAQADAEPDQPTPIRGERRAMTTSSLAWVGAGGVLVLLGLAAWWRARRA